MSTIVHSEYITTNISISQILCKLGRTFAFGKFGNTFLAIWEGVEVWGSVVQHQYQWVDKVSERDIGRGL